MLKFELELELEKNDRIREVNILTMFQEAKEGPLGALSHDSWFSIAQYLTHTDLCTLCKLNRDTNDAIDKESVWQVQCQRIFGYQKDVWIYEMF